MDLHESRGFKSLVMKVKREIFSNDVVDDPYSLLPPSAYDTAWLAMIPNPHQVQPDRPLFNVCLDWVLGNQNTGGFWGDQTTCGRPTIDCLTATLACIVALRTWNVGDAAIRKGLAFIQANTKKLLVQQNGCLPRWFIIVFPAMIELAQTKGLDVRFSDCSAPLVEQVFLERQKMFEIRDAVCGQQHYPLAMNATYIEAWPKTCSNYQNAVLIDQIEDGSVFQSPSATAFAFMTTGNTKFLAYLESIVKRCGHGVPPIYPLDEEVIEISVVDWIENLGLTEQFKEEIQNVLSRVFRSYASTEEPENYMGKHVNPQQLYRDSLAFRLLRLHGYTVSPRKFCWFIDEDDKVQYIEEQREIFRSAMYSVYRAADVIFTGETQLEAARAFSKRILENETLEISEYSVFSKSNLLDDDQIKEELRCPWLARLDHLEHRKCIERKEIIGPWSGKAPFYRFSFQRNATLQQLAIENFTLRQSIFRNELKELERWSKGFGLRDLGFAREKTTCCYFAVAATVSLPSLSDVRLALVKSAILVTVADDFFDAEGSLEELEALTNALHKWEGKDLNGHSKVIFNALEDLVEEISSKFFNINGYDIRRYVQDIWHQTFLVWLKEAEWSRNGFTPSIKEYIEVATSSIATQTIVLPASLLLSPAPPLLEALEFPQAETVTHLLMILTRLLNDSQSYQRENEEGKSNLVLLYMKENPNFGLEDSIIFIQKMIEEKKKSFLELVLMNGKSDMPEACRQLHLFCLKAFQMFYNSTNAFDSTTELLGDIKRAIYDPLSMDTDGEYSSMAPLKSSEGFGLMKEEAELESRLTRNKNESNGRGLIGSRSFTASCGLSNWSSQSIQRKELVANRFKGVLPLKIQKPNFYVTFPKTKACVNYPCLR